MWRMFGRFLFLAIIATAAILVPYLLLFHTERLTEPAWYKHLAAMVVLPAFLCAYISVSTHELLTRQARRPESYWYRMNLSQDVSMYNIFRSRCVLRLVIPLTAGTLVTFVCLYPFIVNDIIAEINGLGHFVSVKLIPAVFSAALVVMMNEYLINRSEPDVHPVG
jgi:hypothetical protein